MIKTQVSAQDSQNKQGAHSRNASLDDSWYLAATKPKQEFRALENLEYQGVRPFLPTINLEKIVRGKRQIKTEPLFPGYLFINITEDDPLWHKVRSTRGIRDWIRFSGKAAKIPSELVSKLIGKQAEEKSEGKVHESIKMGDKVRIDSGPFKGLEAIYQMADGEERALVLIEFLGKTSLLPVENEQIIIES